MPSPITKTDLKLKQKIIANAISRMSLKELSKEMDRLGWGVTFIAEIAGYLKRADSLIIQHQNEKKEQLRDKFLNDIVQLVHANCRDCTHEIQDAARQLQIAENGFRRILSYIEATDWHQLAPDLKAATILQCASEMFSEALDAIIKQVSEKKRVNFGTPVFHDENGQSIDIEASGEEIMSGLAGSLMMIAYKEKWFQNETLILPKLPVVEVNDTIKAKRPLIFNSHWRAWRNMEQAARFLGPDLEVLSESQMPSGIPKTYELAYRYSPTTFEWYNHAATWRINDRMREYRINAGLGDIKSLAKTLDLQRSLAPLDFVSENEILGYIELNNRLGLKIENSKRLIGGLKIVEWLRGYAVLSVLAKQRFGDDKKYLQVWNLKELEKTLSMGGLQSDKAKIFLSNAALGKARSDLYDSPLLTLHDGSMILVAPCVLDSNPAAIIISVLARFKLRIDGTPFEERVLETFRAHGIPAEAFSFKNKKEQYQLDTVVNWGDHVFLIECKNLSLPGKNAVSAYHFEKRVLDSKQQIIRLRDGLLAAPDELDKRFGDGTSQKPIIMVVLSNQPYSTFSNENDVHFYDLSALQKFFQSKYLTMKVGNWPGPFEDIHITKLWDDDTPTSHDLLEQLKNAAQLKTIEFHIEISSFGFKLDEKAVALTLALQRREYTLESMLLWRDKQLQEKSLKLNQK